jgi:competence protein ComEC
MKTLKLFALLFAALIHGAVLVVAQPAAGELAVHFINVGQGDCTLVVFPSGKRLLVDCGSTDGPFNATKVRTYIRKYLDPVNPKIDLLVITHPDADHYNKIPAIFGDANSPVIPIVKMILVGDLGEYGSADMDTWLSELPANRLTQIKTQEYNTYPSKSLPGFEQDGVRVLAANVQASYSPSNARSIVLKITHGQIDFMITGDATRDTDSTILSKYQGHEQELDVEVWKGAHHGSWATATHSANWANAVQPEAVVFSCSKTNDYGHPNRNLAEKFKGYTVAVTNHRIAFFDGKNDPSTATENKPYRTEAMYSTASSGNILIRTDGQTFTTKLGNN